MKPDLAQLQARLGYTFRDPTLLTRALTHRSFTAEHPDAESNQRLEFLGDAILQILLADALFKLFPLEREGILSKRRSLLVNQIFLAGLARELGLETCLQFSDGEERSGGRDRPSAQGDAFEALVGAVYLDSDFPTVQRTIMALYGDLTARLASTESTDNPKGRLQELVQPVHGNHAVRYTIAAIEGEDHARHFDVEVFLHDRLLGRGRGTSKKLAEESAAREALITLADPANFPK